MAAAAKPRKAAKAPARAAATKPKGKAEPAASRPRQPAAKPGKTAPKGKAKPAAPLAPAPAAEETAGAEPQAVAPPAPPSASVGWAPVPAASPPAPPAFDPATGAWLRQPAGIPPLARVAPAQDAPDAPKKGTTSYVLWSILLWIDLGLLALQALAVVFAGLVLILMPESALAQTFRDSLEIASPRDLFIGSVASFLLFGAIPFAWVMGTRRQPVEGTKRFLRLHDPAMGILRGVLLTIPLLIAVVILSSLYIIATEGVDALSEPQEDANPAVQAILDNLTWPLAVVVALCAGVGEEIFFRGLLQRSIGLWGQAVLFGLAHAAGGYIPQIVFAFGMAVLFGYLLKRGWSLWTLITAHVLYDFTLLALALATG